MSWAAWSTLVTPLKLDVGVEGVVGNNEVTEELVEPSIDET
jgi:hypothetical protein